MEYSVTGQVAYNEMSSRRLLKVELNNSGRLAHNIVSSLGLYKYTLSVSAQSDKSWY